MDRPSTDNAPAPAAASDALAIVGATIECAPRAVALLDPAGTVLVANRLARMRYDLAAGLGLGTVIASDARTLQRGLDQAVGLSRAVPLLLRLGDQPMPFYIWRVAPLPGFSTPLIMLKEDTSKPLAAKLTRSEISRTIVEQRLTLSEDERDRLRTVARRLQSLAETDHLTGLLNAAAFSERVRARLRDQAPGLLVYLDLDRFKPVNDRFGHDAGDHVLQMLGRRLSEATRPDDLIGRLGGDEFALWLDEASRENCHALVARLRARLAAPVAWQADDTAPQAMLHVTVSLGTALAPDEGQDLQALRRLAEARMFGQKGAIKAANR